MSFIKNVFIKIGLVVYLLFSKLQNSVVLSVQEVKTRLSVICQ